MNDLKKWKENSTGFNTEKLGHTRFHWNRFQTLHRFMSTYTMIIF